MELRDLQGVGKTRLAALHAAGIDSLRDLLFAAPIRYQDFAAQTPVADARDGERAALCVKRIGEPKLARHGKLSRVTCLFADESAEVTACWFNQP